METALGVEGNVTKTILYWRQKNLSQPTLDRILLVSTHILAKVQSPHLRQQRHNVDQAEKT